eukprot:834952_1
MHIIQMIYSLVITAAHFQYWSLLVRKFVDLDHRQIKHNKELSLRRIEHCTDQFIITTIIDMIQYILLTLWPFITYCTKISMTATVCVLPDQTVKHQGFIGKTIPEISNTPFLFNTLTSTQPRHKTSLEYRFNIIWCDLNYYNGLYDAFIERAQSNVGSIQHCLNPVFVTNFGVHFSTQNKRDTQTIKTLVSRNYVAHSSNVLGTLNHELSDIPKQDIERSLMLISKSINVSRSNLVIGDDIMVPSSSGLRHWFKDWTLMEDSKSMVLFENKATQQQLMLLKDIHTNKNSQHQKLINQWKASMYLMETEPLQFAIDLGNKRLSSLAEKSMRFVGRSHVAIASLGSAVLAKYNHCLAGLLSALFLAFAYFNKVFLDVVASAIRHTGLNNMEMVDIILQNDQNASLVFADWKDLSRQSLGFWALNTKLDQIARHPVFTKNNSKFVNTRMARSPESSYVLKKAFMSSSINLEEFLKIIQIGQPFVQRYAANSVWEWQYHRSSLIWQYLMGLAQPQFIKRKRIVGLFGALHVQDIIHWHNTKNLNTFFPSDFLHQDLLTSKL